MTPTNSLERIIAMWENRAAGHVRRIRELEAERDEWQRRCTEKEQAIAALTAERDELRAGIQDLTRTNYALADVCDQLRAALVKERRVHQIMLDDANGRAEAYEEMYHNAVAVLQSVGLLPSDQEIEARMRAHDEARRRMRDEAGHEPA